MMSSDMISYCYLPGTLITGCDMFFTGVALICDFCDSGISDVGGCSLGEVPVHPCECLLLWPQHVHFPLVNTPGWNLSCSMELLQSEEEGVACCHGY